MCKLYNGYHQSWCEHSKRSKTDVQRCEECQLTNGEHHYWCEYATEDDVLDQRLAMAKERIEKVINPSGTLRRWLN